MLTNKTIEVVEVWSRTTGDTAKKIRSQKNNHTLKITVEKIAYKSRVRSKTTILPFDTYVKFGRHFGG